METNKFCGSAVPPLSYCTLLHLVAPLLPNVAQRYTLLHCVLGGFGGLNNSLHWATGSHTRHQLAQNPFVSITDTAVLFVRTSEGSTKRNRKLTSWQKNRLHNVLSVDQHSEDGWAEGSCHTLWNWMKCICLQTIQREKGMDITKQKGNKHQTKTKRKSV